MSQFLAQWIGLTKHCTDSVYKPMLCQSDSISQEFFENQLSLSKIWKIQNVDASNLDSFDWQKLIVGVKFKVLKYLTKKNLES